MKKLKRSTNNIVFTGLLGGLGEYFDIDPVVVRLIFLFFIFITGLFPGVLFYFIALLLVPMHLEGARKNVEHTEVK
jgi:phage shock protein C